MAKEVILTLDKLVYGGAALGRLPDGRAAFVPLALPGETVRARIVKEARGHVQARLIEVLTPAPQRISPRCPHFGLCGGCHYQHLSYADQLQAKEEILRDQLQRLGKIKEPPVQPIVPAPKPWHYRNHVQFHLDSAGRLGFIRQDNEGVLPIETCFLPEQPIADFWPQLQLDADTSLERISLRTDSYGDLMLTLYAASPDLPEIISEAGVSIAHVVADDTLLVGGDDHLTFEILGKSFRVSPAAFFQVNTLMAEKMVQHLLDNLHLPVRTVLDVYCGGGLFSAFLAPHCETLIGVETSPAACEDFSINLDACDHVALYEAPAEVVLPSLDVRADLIVVDPPREGLHPRALDAIVRAAAREIAYISCDPATLARDAARLQKQGYRLRQVTPFDLFPQTYHIESISFFDRAA